MRWTNVWRKDQDHAQSSLLRCYMTNTSKLVNADNYTSCKLCRVSDGHHILRENSVPTMISCHRRDSEESPFHMTVCKTKEMRDPIATGYWTWHVL